MVIAQTLRARNVLRDRVSGQSKGTGFVRFARTEDASLAIEEMNGKTLPGCPAPLEVSSRASSKLLTQQTFE